MAAGGGLMLPAAHEGPDPPGWWGLLFLLVADAVHFGSLMFGYAFLWTIAPNWPPPEYLTPDWGGPLAALAAALALWLGPRLIGRAVQTGRTIWIGALLTGTGLALMALASGLVILDRPKPDRHAYDATLWILAGHVALHVFVGLVMLGHVVARILAGYASPRRIGEVNILRLWTDFTWATGLIALGAAWMPGGMP